jgi:hypothetical protein
MGEFENYHMRSVGFYVKKNNKFIKNNVEFLYNRTDKNYPLLAE